VRKVRGWRPASAGACAVLILACGSVSTGPSNDHRIATGERDPQLRTILDGVLNAQINSDGTACLWISAEETRVAAIWPPGFTARGNPLVLYDEKGSRVAAAGEKLKVGAGQVRSISTQPVLGCTGLSESVVGGPLLPAPEAQPGTQIYTSLEVSHMQELVDTYPDIFGGMWGDPKTHVITISIVPGADASGAASAKAQVVAGGSSSNPSDTNGEWRIGFITAGPSLAKLNQIMSQIPADQPWRDDVGSHLASWGVDPLYHDVLVGLDLITPTMAQDALSEFDGLVILQTSGRATAV
jgi:hypothetical protein